MMKCLAIFALVAIHQSFASTDLVSSASNDFATRLYQKIAETPGNVLVCPLSLHVALTLVHQGAGGNTAHELLIRLGLSGSNQQIKTSYQQVLQSIKDDTLKIATKLYPASDVKLNEKYVNDAKDYYFSGVEKLNFTEAAKSADIINKYVEENTNHKITNLISPSSLDARTRLVIVNAVHFQASWKTVFPTSFDGNFWVKRDKKVKTKMMSQTNMFGYKEDARLRAKVLKMDYDVEGYSMVIVLPNQIDGLVDIEAELAKQTLPSLLEGLEQTRVEVTIPKFTLEQTLDLSGILKTMGIKEVFTPQANLRNVAQGENLHVSQIVQKTFINVHENGTEAAASTALLQTLSAAQENPVFFVNHPFHFFLLRDKMPLQVLFEGRLVNPTEEYVGHNAPPPPSPEAISFAQPSPAYQHHFSIENPQTSTPHFNQRPVGINQNFNKYPNSNRPSQESNRNPQPTNQLATQSGQENINTNYQTIRNQMSNRNSEYHFVQNQGINSLQQPGTPTFNPSGYYQENNRQQGSATNDKNPAYR